MKTLILILLFLTSCGIVKPITYDDTGNIQLGKDWQPQNDTLYPCMAYWNLYTFQRDSCNSVMQVINKNKSK